MENENIVPDVIPVAPKGMIQVKNKNSYIKNQIQNFQH